MKWVTLTRLLQFVQFCQETLKPGINVEPNTTHPNSVTDKVHSLKAMALLMACTPLSHKNCSGMACEECEKSSRCGPGLKIPQIPILLNICETSWNKSDPWRPHLTTHRTQRICHQCPCERHHRTLAKVLSLCLTVSELFCRTRGIYTIWGRWFQHCGWWVCITTQPHLNFKIYNCKVPKKSPTNNNRKTVQDTIHKYDFWTKTMKTKTLKVPAA